MTTSRRPKSVRALARLGILTAPQLERDEVGKTLVHIPIYLHPGSSPDPVSVSWQTVNGTAKAGQDYIANGGTLQFSPGTVSQEVIVSLIGDKVAEAQEGFNIKLTGAQNAYVDPTYQYSLVTIRDDDGAAHCPGYAGSSKHQVVGTAGADTLRGTRNADIVCGLGGKDTLIGRGGDDILLGGQARTCSTEVRAWTSASAVAVPTR